jgi:sporulation protein YlmC with PRC-barrel domain
MAAKLLLALILAAFAGAASAQSSWINMPASEFLGREVVSPEGNSLGEVEDVVIDVRRARVHYAVLAFGGWMGLGEDLYAVPIHGLAPEAGSQRVVMHIDTAPLVNVPGFARDAWPTDRYWGGIEGPARPPLRRFVRASELIGRGTTDRKGEHAGEIEDAVLDLRHGVVRYLLFDYDESWGPDQPPLRLAPQAFSFPRDGGDAVVNVARERLADPDAAEG